MSGYLGRGFCINQTISNITVKGSGDLIAASAHTNNRGDFVEILYIIEGKPNYFIEGDFYALEPCDAVFSNPTEIHGIVHSSSGVYNRLHIKVEPVFFMINNLEETKEKLNNKFPGEGNYVSHSSIPGRMLAERFEQLREYLSTPKASPDLINDTIIEILKLFTSQVHSKKGKLSNPLLRKMIAYISENVHSDIGLSSIAEEFHINRTHLARIFKELTKCTVNQYITIKRLDHAEQLRKYSHLSHAEAARAVGFKNYSTYYRAYKKYHGFAPKKTDLSEYNNVISVDFDANH